MIEKRELIWLDPQGGAEHVCIGIEDGKDIRVNVVQTLDQIPPALGTSDAIIVRLIDDCALLRDMQLLMQESQLRTPELMSPPNEERENDNKNMLKTRNGVGHFIVSLSAKALVFLMDGPGCIDRYKGAI